MFAPSFILCYCLVFLHFIHSGRAQYPWKVTGDGLVIDQSSKSVPYQADYECTTKCDTNARCGRGLLSGNYLCICRPGYYGSGAEGHCTHCPPGTYRTAFGLAEYSCTDCPENSNHNKYGSTTLDDCKCNQGYEGRPSGIGCFIKTCLNLIAPNNGYTNPTTCTSNYGSICEFKCNDGFKLVGHQVYTCTVRDDNEGHAFWDHGNIAPTCQRIVCDSTKSKVDNAYETCDTADFRVGTKCNYKCIDAYRQVGSGTKECRGDGTWSGQDTSCELITCSHLNAMAISTVNNPNCIDNEKRPPVYTNCEFSCPPGYVFKKAQLQTVVRYCQQNGKWSKEDDVCIDIEAPRFTSCPSNQVVDTTYRTNVAKNVQWDIPTYYDNSLAVEGDQLTLVEEHGYTSPRDFPIGTTMVKYTVKDKSNLQNTCQFEIIVEDKEPPYNTYCPEDIKKPYIAENVQGMQVSWPKPEFKDNSGKDPTVLSIPPSSSYFREGIHLVSYTAVDESGNTDTSCQFQVILEEPTCSKRTNPKNGALACFQQPGGSKVCNSYCQEGYDFSYKPEGVYVCYQRKWQYFRGQFQIFMTGHENWPDCAVRTDPSSANLKMSQSFYYNGNCNDKDVQDSLKSNYHQYLLSNGPFYACLLFGTECSPAKIEIYCGATDLSRRRRRGVDEMENFIKLSNWKKKKNL